MPGNYGLKKPQIEKIQELQGDQIPSQRNSPFQISQNPFTLWKKSQTQLTNEGVLDLPRSADRRQLETLIAAAEENGGICFFIAVHIYDFHLFPAIIHHLEALFGSNIMTSSQLAC